MTEDLLLKPDSKLWSRLTEISGNVDLDKLIPSIWISQITDIRRILTEPLYDKIFNDFINNELSGDYLTIYNKYVSVMLVFFSASDFVLKNSVMITNGGNFQHLPNNAQIVSSKENERLSKYYRELAINFEREFYEFMKDKNIPEFQFKYEIKTFIFGWDI